MASEKGAPEDPIQGKGVCQGEGGGGYWRGSKRRALGKGTVKEAQMGVLAKTGISLVARGEPRQGGREGQNHQKSRSHQTEIQIQLF